MTETELRTLVCEMLAPLAAFKLENGLVSERGNGVPDVCCTSGFVELKIASSPTRATTRVDVDVRASQRVWHRNWRLAGGRSTTLTLIDDVTWLLHDGYWSSDFLGRVPMTELTRHALWTESLPDVVDEDARHRVSRGLMLAMMRPMVRV